MDFVSYVLVIILSVIVCVLIFGGSRIRNLPPGPPRLPVLGNLLRFYNKNILHEFDILKQKYGDMFTVQLGSSLMVVISGYDRIKEVFQKRGDEFVDRPDNFVHKTVLKHLGIVSSNGKTWREQRTFGTATLRHFGIGKKNIEFSILEECEVMSNYIKGTNGGPFDIQHVAQNASANVICSLVFGKRYEHNDPLFLKMASTYTQYLKEVSAMGIVNAFPVLLKLPGDLFNQYKLKRIHDVGTSYITEIIDEHKTSFDEENPRDFVDCYLKEIQRQRGCEDSSFTEQQLVQVVHNLFLAGMETTATTTGWAIVYILHYPDVQRKLHNEIESVLGSKPPAMENKKDMHYMAAFLEEIQRISDVAPLAVEHAPTRDVTLFGYEIPKETALILNLHSVAFDPDVFPEPNLLKPERFLDEKGRFISNGKSLPFGIGPRNCFGESLARTELFLFMTTILQQFDIMESEEGKPSLEPVFGGTNVPKPFKFIAVQR